MEVKKLLKVADVRKRMDAHYRDEISYSKAVELLNEDANKALNIANVSNWVAVVDKLPPNENRKYLVIRDGEIEICKWMYRENGRGYWWNYLGITHWMLLPEPPCC